MKRRLHTIGFCAAAAVAAGLTGCSVHPLPQDVSFANTVQIVKRVRCEAKEGLEEALKKAALQGPVRKKHVEKIIAGTAIGFEFKFEMGETNKAESGTLTFTRDGANGGEKFELTLNADLNDGHGADNSTRMNTRIFRVVDELKDLKDAPCGRREATTGPNLVYPITGSTGMAEVVRTYIELEAMTDLASQGEMVTFSDELDFTTTLETGAAIDVSLRTPVGSLRLSRATVTGSLVRKDTHSVWVVLARDRKHRDVDLPDSEMRMAARKGQVGGPKLKDVRGKGLQTFLVQKGETSRNRVFIELEKQRRAENDRAVAERVLGTKLP
jgi:hypothetical protein